MRGGAGILDDGHTSRALDGPESGRAVDAGAREHDADGAGTIAPGHRLEHEIDRRPRVVDELRAAQLDPATGDEQVHVRRRDVNDAGDDLVVVRGLADLEPTVPSKEIRQETVVMRMKMLDDQDRRPEIA